MKAVAALLIGTLFGAGLTLSEMVDPRRVLGFLDLAGSWDPTLAFVMGGALAVAGPGIYLVRRRERPVLDEEFEIPTNNELDPRLLGGAALFGIGWGLVGVCPGPSLAALGIAAGVILPFLLMMIAGSLVYDQIVRPRITGSS